MRFLESDETAKFCLPMNSNFSSITGLLEGTGNVKYPEHLQIPLNDPDLYGQFWRPHNLTVRF